MPTGRMKTTTREANNSINFHRPGEKAARAELAELHRDFPQAVKLWERFEEEFVQNLPSGSVAHMACGTEDEMLTKSKTHLESTDPETPRMDDIR